MGGALTSVIAMMAHNGRMTRAPSPPAKWRGRPARRDAGDATPIVVVGGILTGVVTPTEAAVVAAVYALRLGFFHRRSSNSRTSPRSSGSPGDETIQVMIIIAAAGALGWMLIQQQIPNAIIEGILSLTTAPWVVLLLVNVMLLMLGCFIETIAIMIIVTPIFLPLMVKIGVTPEQFGVIMVLNLMIGLMTPPVGLCLYAISTMSGVPRSELAREIGPYLPALLVVLGIVTYVPSGRDVATQSLRRRSLRPWPF